MRCLCVLVLALLGCAPRISKIEAPHTEGQLQHLERVARLRPSGTGRHAYWRYLGAGGLVVKVWRLDRLVVL